MHVPKKVGVASKCLTHARSKKKKKISLPYVCCLSDLRYLKSRSRQQQREEDIQIIAVRGHAGRGGGDYKEG